MNTLIIFCGKYLFVFVVLALIVAWLRTNRSVRAQFAAATVLAGVIALVISRLAAKAYFDPRPFVSQHLQPLITHAADNGFPSDHALFTMTLTAIAFFYNKKIAGVMLILTVLVGIARVLAKVHSPLDIGAGWVIGIVGAAVGQYFTVWLLSRYRGGSAVTASTK